MKGMGALALLGLAVGLAAGLAAPYLGVPPGVADALAWFVRAWTQALAIVAVPLVLSQLFAAVVRGVGSTSSNVRLGAVVPAVMATLLVLAAAVTLALTSGLLSLPWFDSLSLATGDAARSASSWTEPAVTVDVLSELLPQAIVARAISGDLLAMIALTLVTALLARRIGDEGRHLLVSFSDAVSTLAFTAVGLLLVAAPAIVFAAVFGAMRASGFEIGTVLAVNAAMKTVVTLAVVAALYGVVALVGIPVRRFASATAPGQLVALTTRSSLASLPALMTGARERLGLDAAASGGLLGLAGAALKLSGPVSGTFKFLFLAHVLGVSLSPTQIGAFVLTILATSATTVGIPRMTSESSALAFYAAAGMPLEYVVLLSTTTVLTDPISTMLNTTAYMAFTSTVCRLGFSKQPAAAAGAATAM